MVSKQTEERLILSILNAHLEIPPVPWHITLLGWKHYINHRSKKVHYRALHHPHCPQHLRSRVIPMRLARELMRLR